MIVMTVTRIILVTMIITVIMWLQAYDLVSESMFSVLRGSLKLKLYCKEVFFEIALASITDSVMPFGRVQAASNTAGSDVLDFLLQLAKNAKPDDP